MSAIEMLAVEGLSLSFSGLRALDDVSFSLPPGRIVGLIVREYALVRWADD